MAAYSQARSSADGMSVGAKDPTTRIPPPITPSTAPVLMKLSVDIA
jgi:hypothetical protein